MSFFGMEKIGEDGTGCLYMKLFSCKETQKILPGILLLVHHGRERNSADG